MLDVRQVGEKELKLPGCSSIGMAASRIRTEHWASVVQAVFSQSQHLLFRQVVLIGPMATHLNHSYSYGPWLLI